MDPDDGRQIAAPTPGEAAELYIAADYEGEGDGRRTVFVRPLDGGADLKFIVEVATETTFTARLAEGGAA